MSALLADRTAVYAVHMLTQQANFRGSNVDTWTPTGETVLADLQTLDESAVNVAGARGRNVSRLAFVQGVHHFEPEAVRLVGIETWLVTESYGVYSQHTELGVMQIES